MAAGDRRAAMSSCTAAAGSSLLASRLSEFLAQPASGDVYVDPYAFERFISGGSNVGLYAATIEALHELNEREGPSSLLDIGCGDGRIAVGTVPRSCERLHLLEPSEAMLRVAVDRFEHAGHVTDSTSSTLQDLLVREPDLRWNAVQSTFALHNLTPTDRDDALAALASRTQSIGIVEFDVPDFVDRSRDHAEYAAAAYEIGVSEYDADPIVITGFLLPVLVGQFASEQPRHTYEQSADSWARGLEHAGFTSVTTAPIAEYWWANATLIHGHHARRAGS